MRLAECQLELHPTKTRIVYCKDDRRKGSYPNVKFDFLGYEFRPRAVWGAQRGRLLCGFTPAVSPSALKTMRPKVRDLNIRQRTQVSLDDIAQDINPLLGGWIGYYGRYTPSALAPMLRYVNLTLLAWAMRRFRRRKTRTALFLERLVKEHASLLVHCQLGMPVSFS